EHCRSTALVGSIDGSKLANTCAVGQMPGQPIGLAAPVPAPLGFVSPKMLPVGHVPAGNTHLPAAFEPIAKCCTSGIKCASAAAPVAASVSTNGACTSDVPAPYSNARPFIGCF